jgi:methionyl-tRNA synthetase
MSEETLQTPVKPQISFADFTKLDLRVATVTAAEPHPNADKLIKIQLDDGTGEPRQVCAGIKAWYEPPDLVGKQVVIVANLEPRKLRGEMSQGMVLCATTGAGGQPEDVVLLGLDRSAPAGSPVT